MAHQKTNIIWDLSGTLFRPSPAGLSPQEFADFSLIFFMWSGKKKPSELDTLALSVLQLLRTNNFHAQNSSQSETIRLHTGEAVPPIIGNYLAGTTTSQQAINELLTTFEHWEKQNPTISQNDKEQIKRMLIAFFKPDTLERCMKPIEATVTLAHQCAQNKNHLFILSNWDRESFAPFYEKYAPTALSVFPRSQIVISGEAGFVKPQRGIYHYLLKRFQLDARKCFFIDDQQENVEAAKSFGIESLRITHENTEQLETLLKNLNII